MAYVLRKRRLANAARRRRRNMTPKQIKFFGTKRQRAALRNAGYGSIRRSKKRYKREMQHISPYRTAAHKAAYRAKSKRRRRNQGGGIISQAEHAASRAIRSVEQAAEDAIGAVTRQVNGRRRNVGEILTVLPANPGRRRRSRVARVRRRRNRGRVRLGNRRRTSNRRRRTYNRRRHNSPRVVVRYRNRRHHRRHNRRRNQGIMGGGLGGDIGKVVGVLGGAVLTGIVTGFLPSSMTTGTMGWVTTGITAVVLGQVAGRMMKNRSLGTFVTVGGLLLVALPLLSQFFPSLALPFTTGTHGLGLITSSNFYVPQVNMPGSMASFVTPAGIAAAIPAPVSVPATALRGLGQGASPLIGLRSARRTGRLR